MWRKGKVARIACDNVGVGVGVAERRDGARARDSSESMAPMDFNAGPSVQRYRDAFHPFHRLTPSP